MGNHEEMAKMLISRGADINSVNTVRFHKATELYSELRRA